VGSSPTSVNILLVVGEFFLLVVGTRASSGVEIFSSSLELVSTLDGETRAIPL
jgi:hypothetical protein